MMVVSGIYHNVARMFWQNMRKTDWEEFHYRRVFCTAAAVDCLMLKKVKKLSKEMLRRKAVSGRVAQ